MLTSLLNVVAGDKTVGDGPCAGRRSNRRSGAVDEAGRHYQPKRPCPRDSHLNDAPATTGLSLTAQTGILTIHRDRPPSCRSPDIRPDALQGNSLEH